MSGTRASGAVRAGRVLLFALGGGAVALLIGLTAVALAPDDGFGDLAAAAVTKVFLVPLGVLLGAAIGWWRSRPTA